jgi:hypothetical protein
MAMKRGGKMDTEQTYNCDNFDSPLCPNRKEELMRGFIRDTGVSRGTLDFSKAEEVNKTFCNTCDSFKKD